MKVGHCDLLFCVLSGFASGSSHARLQVSVYSSYDLRHPGCPKMFLSIVTLLIPKSRSIPGTCCISVRCTHGANLVTAGQQAGEIMQI